jgi:hypothetical protein
MLREGLPNPVKVMKIAPAHSPLSAMRVGCIEADSRHCPWAGFICHMRRDCESNAFAPDGVGYQNSVFAHDARAARTVRSIAAMTGAYG